jgi:hypothetical protein
MEKANNIETEGTQRLLRPKSKLRSRADRTKSELRRYRQDRGKGRLGSSEPYLPETESWDEITWFERAS